MPRKQERTSDSVLHLTELDGGQIVWSVSEMALNRAHRFKQFQQAVTNPIQPSLALLAARLIAFDGVSPEALKLLEEQGVKPYRMGEQLGIEWIALEPVRTERRLLNPMTLLAWPISIHDTKMIPTDGLVAALKKWLPTLGGEWSQKNSLDELNVDQLCWLQEQVPGVLFGHLAGMATISALPKSAWARLETKRPLIAETALEVSETGVTVTLLFATLDAEGDHYNTTLVRMVEDIFSSSTHTKIDGHIKRAWANELGKLEGRLRRAHPAVALVIAWAAHLCEAGTLETANPAASTVKKYVKRAMLPLGSLLKDLPPDVHCWDSHRLSKIYGTLMGQTKVSSRGEMSAALGSFQAFLEDWFDIPPVSCPKGDWTPGKPTVRSNILWEHEIELALRMCNGCEDERLGRMASCCILIARENPVRMQDLLRLRICNFHQFADECGQALEIEVVRDAGRGRLKTAGSQRRLWVRNQRAIKTIQEWLSFRMREAAPSNALLFGERGNDQAVYRQAALHSFLNAVVKQVTGDPGVRFHHFRHTRISQELDALLRSVGTTDINRLEVLAANAGHSTPYTTLGVYSHVYEDALRMWLDLALMEQLSLTGRQAQDWLGDKANTLVQAARRRKVTLIELVMERLATRTLSINLQNVSAGVVLGEAVLPKAGHRRAVNITPAVIADSVIRLANGAPHGQVAQLLDIDVNTLQAVEENLNKWLKEMANKLYPRKTKKWNGDNLLALFEFLDIDTKRMFGDRLLCLRDYLSQEVPRNELVQATLGWERCGHGDHVALGTNKPVRGLLRLLKNCGLPVNAVRLIHQHAEQVEPSHARLKDLGEVTRVFVEEWGMNPIVETRKLRVDRPDLYLLISSQPEALQTPSAASLNGVLKAWLMACQAYLIFDELQMGRKN